MGTTTITNQYMLDLGVNFIVGQLLALALVIEKQLTKGLFKDGVVQFCVNIFEFHESLKARKPYL